MGTGVLLDGWYGRRNAGDDAFCVVGVARYADALGVDAVTIHTAPSGLPELPPVRTAWPGPARVRGLRRLQSLRAAVERGAVVHLGGSRFANPTTAVRDQVRLRRRVGVSLHAQSISIGPFVDDGHRHRTAEVLAPFDTISVRDRASVDRAAEIGLDVLHVADAAVLLPDVWGLPTPERDLHAEGPATDGAEGEAATLRVGLALRGDALDEGEDPARAARREAGLVALLRDLAARTPSLHVDLLGFNPDDEPAGHRVAAHVADVAVTRVVPYSRSTREVFDAVAACDAVVAMRLHAGIFAYAAGVPFAQVDYHGKCRDFVAEVGADPSLLVDVDGPTAEQHDAVLRMVLEPAAHRPPTLDLATSRSRAQAGFELVLNHVLGHGPATP